jgi:hypothetical protein
MDSDSSRTVLLHWHSQKASGVSRIVYLVSTLDRLRKLDMVQHYKWIAYGCDHYGLGGKGAKRQRLHAHAPEIAPARLFLGTLSESLVSWHSSSFGRLWCITSIYSRVGRFKPVDTLEVAPSCLQVVALRVMVLDFGRVINLT